MKPRARAGVFCIPVLLLFSLYIAGSWSAGLGAPKILAQTVAPVRAATILTGYSFLAGPNPGNTPATFWMIGLGATDPTGTSDVNLGPPMPTPGILRNLTVAAGSGQNVPITVYVNNTASNLTCMLHSDPAPAQRGSCADTQHQVPVRAGDIVGVAAVLSPNQEVIGNLRVSLEKQ